MQVVKNKDGNLTHSYDHVKALINKAWKLVKIRLEAGFFFSDWRKLRAKKRKERRLPWPEIKMPFSTTDGALILYVYQSNISDWEPSLDLKRSVLANSEVNCPVHLKVESSRNSVVFQIKF